MWSIEYVQIPIVTTEEVVAKPEISPKKTLNLTKEADIITTLAKSASDSSISEAGDSLKETSKRYEVEKDECSENEESSLLDDEAAAAAAQSSAKLLKKHQSLDVAVLSKRPSITSAKSLHELKDSQMSKTIPGCVFIEWFCFVNSNVFV